MKKILFCLVALVMTISAFNFAIASNEVTLSIPDINLSETTEFEVPINIENNEKGVSTLQLFVNYDSSLFTYKECKGNIFGGTIVVNPNYDNNTISINAMATENYSGDGSLLTMVFSVNGDYKNISSSLTLSAKELCYIDLNEPSPVVNIADSVVIKNGSVNIAEETTTTEATTEESSTETTTTEISTEKNSTETTTIEISTEETTTETTTTDISTEETSTETTTVEISTEETSTETTTEEILYGDVNLDKRVNFSDAILILRYSSNTYELDEDGFVRADMDKNNIVNFADAILVLRKASA